MTAPEKLPPLRLIEPSLQPSRGRDATPTWIALLIASGVATSQAELATVTGLSRTTVTGVVDRLVRQMDRALSAS